MGSLTWQGSLPAGLRTLNMAPSTAQSHPMLVPYLDHSPNAHQPQPGQGRPTTSLGAASARPGGMGHRKRQPGPRVQDLWSLWRAETLPCPGGRTAPADWRSGAANGTAAFPSATAHSGGPQDPLPQHVMQVGQSWPGPHSGEGVRVSPHFTLYPARKRGKGQQEQWRYSH